MVRLLPVLILSLSFISGCSLQSRKDQTDLRGLFEHKKLSEALSFLEDSDLRSEKKHKLLYLMEKGTLKYYQNNFKSSADIFIKANALVDKLYTKSVKEKLISSVLNDNSETFYASIYERSLLYYYQAMSFYRLSQVGSYTQESKTKDGKVTSEKIVLSKDEISKYKQSTRSTLIAWDSFFQEIKRISDNKSILKEDLTSKLMAAKLHVMLGKRSDKQIALQLYKDARIILINIGPTQKVFNSLYKEYNKQVKEFYNKEIKKSELSKKELTSQYQKSLDHIDLNILSLTKALRSYSLKKEIKKLKPSKSVLGELRSAERNNVELLLELDHISQLEGKDFSFNLNSALENIEDPSTKALVNNIGIPVLTYFAMGPLGLGYASHHGNVSVYSGHNAGTYITKEVGVEFEMPYVQEAKASSHYLVKIFQNEKEVSSKEVSVLNSLSGNAFIHSQEMIESSFKSRSLRVGVKYALAIAAAYSTFETMKKTSGDLFARPAALAQFLISSKGIKETEKADVRHWSTLPSLLASVKFSLPSGAYSIILEEYSNKERTKLVRKATLGKLEVTTQEPALFSYRLF